MRNPLFKGTWRDRHDRPFVPKPHRVEFGANGWELLAEWLASIRRSLTGEKHDKGPR